MQLLVQHRLLRCSHCSIRGRCVPPASDAELLECRKSLDLEGIKIGVLSEGRYFDEDPGNESPAVADVSIANLGGEGSSANLDNQRDAGITSFGFSDDEAFSVGLTCGGTIHLFIEELNW